MATALVTPDEVARLVPQVVEQARSLTVSDAEDYEMACSFLQLVATRKQQVQDTFDPIIRKAHEAHKEAVAQKKRFLEPLLIAEGEVKLKVSRWRNEQESIRQQEETRLREQVRKQAEEQAIAEAAQLEAAGEHDLAEIRLQEAAAAPAPVVVLESAVPKGAGIAARRHWKWRYRTGEIDALRELVAAAAKDESLLAFLQVNETAVGAAVRAQKSLARIPGIETYPDDSVSVRAR